MRMRETPMAEKKEIEEDVSLPREGKLMSAGIFGDVDSDAVADKSRRVEDFKARYNYHEVIPCTACSHCLEMRRFSHEGKAYSVGCYCFLAEMPVEEFGTCINGHKRPDGRRRVIYDTTNAPAGFENGLVPILPKRYYTKKARERAALKLAREGYRGGSSSYVRPDGDREAIGSGVIPRGLWS